jgi:mRNA interferase HigB
VGWPRSLDRFAFEFAVTGSSAGNSGRHDKATVVNRYPRVYISPEKGETAVRIIAKSTLRTFWESNPAHLDAMSPLTEWYRHMQKATYRMPQEVKAELRTASVLKGARVVFNIAGNKYRVILAIDYERQLAFVRFVGTHVQYDQINAETV